MKEIITADATQIPVGDQITQLALRLSKILSQVLAIQRCFLKKNHFWTLHTQTCFISACGFCHREMSNLQRHKEKRLRGGRQVSEKCSPAGTKDWESSQKELNFIRKGKASGACSSGLPLVADLAVSATSIISTVNAILYNSLVSIISTLAMVPVQGAKCANYFLVLTVSWKK